MLILLVLVHFKNIIQLTAAATWAKTNRNDTVSALFTTPIETARRRRRRKSLFSVSNSNIFIVLLLLLL